MPQRPGEPESSITSSVLHAAIPLTLARGAPNLAAASIDAAFNIANSIGAWLGGLAIAAGLGYASVNLVAVGLAALGLAVALFSGRLERRGAPASRGIRALSHG